MDITDQPTTDTSKTYKRSRGTDRGEARRRDLLARISDDLVANGLADFSLRRAARAAGTTHKVLLYYFEGPEDLLHQALAGLRERRRDGGITAAAEAVGTLGSRVRAIWPSLTGDPAAAVLDQAIGLAMADPDRYAGLARSAAQHFLPALMSLFPAEWTPRRQQEVAVMALATLRGLLIEWRTTGDGAHVDAGLDALARALDREADAAT
ncbi:MAG: hypothetical protein ABWX96_05750 [Propionibacteriaceae bacterium]